MNKLYFTGLFILSAFLLSCSKENDATPLVADFTATITGESPNAKVTIVNNSTGASSYNWEFGEGANISSSEANTPTVITVDKAGDFKITLIAKDGSKNTKAEKTVTIAGHNALTSYSNITFGLHAGDQTHGRFFSFETEKIYKDSEVNASNGSKINLAFGSMGYTMYYFSSPTDAEFNVPNATITKVMNYESTPRVSVEQFDTMSDDRLIANLAIENADDSFGNRQIPGTILFETSTGRKGIIRTKSVDNSRIVTDIKIQKY